MSNLALLKRLRLGLNKLVSLIKYLYYNNIGDIGVIILFEKIYEFR